MDSFKTISSGSAALAPACFGGWQGGWGMPMMGWGGGWGFGVFGMIISLLFWAALIIAVVYLIKYLGRGAHHAPGEDAAEILKKRYAKGEITKEDYDRMKKELEKM